MQTQTPPPRAPEPPNTCEGGVGRGGGPPERSPLPRRLKQRSPGARPAGLPKQRAPSERGGPDARRPGPARLPGVAGVPVKGVSEAGAPTQRGAEQRGPEDGPQQGQQPPHRPPRGPAHCPAWPGPARLAAQRSAAQRSAAAARKVQSGRFWGCSARGVGSVRTRGPRPRRTFHQWRCHPAPPSRPTRLNPCRATSARPGPCARAWLLWRPWGVPGVGTGSRS